MTLLGRVVFHLEGAETTARLNASGEPVCLVRTLGSDRWIEDVADGHMTALDLLALAFSHLCFRANDVRAVVHGWREELHRAVEAGEVTPRDPSSRLPCRADFEGLGWLVSRADAARLLERHQTGIDLDATIAELLEVARRRGEEHHHPETGEWIESRWLAGHEPQDWSRPAAIEPVEWCEMLAEGWFMPEAQTPAEPTPAPSASAPAVARPEPVAAPAEAVTVAPKGVPKREMVKRHAARWPTIKTDMKDAGTNGLAAAAKAGERGWREAAALDWARERSRLLSAPEPGTLDAVMGGGFQSRRHTLAR